MNINTSAGIRSAHGAHIQESEAEDHIQVNGNLNGKQAIEAQPYLRIATLFERASSNQEIDSVAMQDDMRERRFSYRNLQTDLLMCISSFLDERSANEIATAFSGERKWAFLRAHPRQHFLALCQGLQAFASILEIPDELKELLKSCTYVEIGRLLELECVRHGASIAELVALFAHVEELRIGDSVFEEFFRNDFSEVMRVSKTLKYLDVSGSKIRDEDLLNIGLMSQLQRINLSSTGIDGSGLSGPAFASVREMKLYGCEKLQDMHLKHCSSKALEKLDLSHTYIDGSSLSGPAFVLVKELKLYKCKNLRDEALKSCSSRKLEKVDLSYTNITGKCFSGAAFTAAEELVVCECWNLTCEGLRCCSIKTVEKMDFSWVNDKEYPLNYLSVRMYVKDDSMTTTIRRRNLQIELQRLHLRAVR